MEIMLARDLAPPEESPVTEKHRKQARRVDGKPLVTSKRKGADSSNNFEPLSKEQRKKVRFIRAKSFCPPLDVRLRCWVWSW